MILRLHDHGGKWAEENYDTVYVGRVKLEDGNIFMTNPEFVCKNYDHVSYLSYHYIDVKTIPEMWNPKSNEYQIE